MTQGYQPPPPPQYAPPGYPAPAAPQYGAPPAAPAPAYPPQYGAPPAPPPAYNPAAPVAPPSWAQAPAPQAPAYGAPAPQFAPQAPAAPAQQSWRQPAVGGFGAVANAAVFTKTPYFPANFDGIVSINELKAILSQNPKSLGQTMFIVECTVVNSTAAPAGACFAQVIKVGQYGAADVKQVMGALFGADPRRTEQLDQLSDVAAFDFAAAQVKMDPNLVPNQPELGANNPRAGGAFAVPIIMWACGQNPTALQPFRGAQLRLQTYEKPKKNSPGMFTMHNWRPANAV